MRYRLASIFGWLTRVSAYGIVVLSLALMFLSHPQPSGIDLRLAIMASGSICAVLVYGLGRAVTWLLTGE